MKRKNIRQKRKDRKRAFGVCESILLKLQPHFCYWPDSRSPNAVKSYSQTEEERKRERQTERERERSREGERHPHAVTAYFQSNRASCETLEANRLQSTEAPVVPNDIMSLTLNTRVCTCMCVTLSVCVPGLIAGVVCSSRGMVGVTVSGRVVVSANRNKKH